MQTDNFARLEGVLTSSFLGLQKTLSDLVLPLASLNKKNLKWPCTHSDTASDSPGRVKASKASYSSAIANGNTAYHASRTNVTTISKNVPTHTLVRPDDPLETELDYNENSGEEYSDDDAYDNHKATDAVSVPDHDS